jgi:hypothetical protein
VTATHEDAVVLMALMNWGTAMGLDDSMASLFAKDPASLSMDDPDVRKALSFGETVGALVKHGVLDFGLISDVFWIDGTWAKVSAHALAARKQENEPSLYENFEALTSMT